MGAATKDALDQIDDVARDGDLSVAPLIDLDEFDLECSTPPIELPDGKRIYPPTLFGEPIHELAARLLDMKDPAASKFLKLIGPPGTGKSQIARAIAHLLWTRRGNEIAERHGEPFYGFVEISGGPSSDEFLFKYDYVAKEDGTVSMVDAAFVEAMRNGWVVMIDEVNTIRDVALLSINSTLDGRLTLYLPSTGETVRAAPGFAVMIAYNPGLVGADDIPDAWFSRFPATLEVTSNWAALAHLGAPKPLVAAAMDLDAKRVNAGAYTGLIWTPQFRDIEALWHMIDRVGERPAISLFVSRIHEQVEAGRIQPAEGEAVTRMLDSAGYGKYRVLEESRTPNLNGYPRAVTG